MTRRSDAALVRDMLDAARAAVEAMSGKAKNDLHVDYVRTLGLVKCLEILGEAAGRVSEQMRADSPDIPWLKMIGMRNRLVHAYFEIDHDQVWKTIKEELPPLILLLESLLKSDGM